MELRSGQRSDPEMIKVLAPLGPDRHVPPPQGVSRQSSREEQLAWAEELGRGLEAALTQANEGAVVPEDVEEKTHSVRGRDGNEILLYIARPLSADGPLPGQRHGPDVSGADAGRVRGRRIGAREPRRARGADLITAY